MDNIQVEDALLDLLSVFEPEKAKTLEFTVIHDNQDMLYSASQHVGKALGISLNRPASSPSKKPLEFLEAIAEVSKFRFRAEKLLINWWENDCGPLLGFLKLSGKPVALIQKKSKYYRIDAEAGEERLLTSEIASTLSDTAYRFYKTLPETVLTWRDLFRFMIGDLKSDLKKILAFQCMVGLIALLFPIFTGVIFETLIPYADTSRLFQIIFVLGVITVVSITFELAGAICLLRVRVKADVMMQSAVWDRVLRLPLSFFRKFTAGDLANRASGIDSIQEYLTSVVVVSILNGFFSLFSLGLMFYYDVWLALAATGLALIAIVITLGFNINQLKYQRPLLEREGKISGFLFQILASIHKLRVANSEKRAFGVWAKKFTEKNRIFLNAALNVIGYNVFYPFYISLSTIVLYALVVMRGENLSFGSFIAFNVAFGQFFAAALAMTSILIRSLSILPLYERVKPILETLPEPEKANTDIGEIKGDILIQSLSFRYLPDTLPVLQEISLSVKAGSMVAIVGETGSGKSTVLRLLLGFEAVPKGSIFYDEHDLNSVNIRALRKQFGVVLQNSVIMPGSIYENITALLPGLTLEDAWMAAERMGIANEIRQMPMGMHTWISEGGRNISVGQRQRILLARAIVHKPKILILDEATSALDNITQASIYEELSHLRMTRIVVAHRLTTVKNADYIYVLHQGNIVQSGTFTDLMEKPGIFADLVERQIL